MENDVILTPKGVEDLTGGLLKVNTLAWWRYRNDGSGPRWFFVSPRKVGYKKSDVIAYLDQQYATTGSGGAA